MLTLDIKKREIYGKKLKDEREKGELPAVLYGPKDDASSVFVDIAKFKKVWHEAGESAVIALKGSGEEKEALIHEVALNPVTDEPIHVDFYIIERGKEITVSIPLEFVGESPAVKNLGGILVKVLHEIEIKALPKDLPQSIEVDISKLTDFNNQILVKDVSLPESSTATEDEDDVIVSVSEPKEEEEEEVGEIDMDSIEVEKKGKEETEGDGDSSDDKKDEAKKESK